MPGFEEAELAHKEEVDSVMIEGGEPIVLDLAKSRLDDAFERDGQPFVMYRYEDNNRLRTAILYRNADGGTVRLTFKPTKPHPVKLLLGILGEYLYPDGEDGYARQGQLLTDIQDALKAATLDAHYFDGGQGKAG